MFKILNFLYLKYLRFKYRNLIIGKNTKIDINTAILINDNKLNIGNHVTLRSRSKGYHAGMPFPTTILIDVANARISIGDGTRLNGVYIHAQKEIIIGNNCVIAAGVNIIDSNGHELKSLDRTKGRDIPKEIYIEDNVWIGLNVIILKGTKIGKNSVVAAGSVVKGVFPENSLIAGNPAVQIDKINF